MIHDGANLPLPLEIDADLCVIGSGAGGAMVAKVAAEAGLHVVVIEAGGFFDPSQMRQREDTMLPRLYWHAAAQTTADRAVRIHQGRGVGGSTLHNLNLCKRIPDAILSEWRRSRGLAHLPLERWHALYTEVEALLEVGPVPAARRNRSNRLLEEACTRLGWRGAGLADNRTGCVGSGFCELGCAYDAKNNACKVLVPAAVAGGCEVLAHVQAVRVLHDGQAVSGVEAVALDAERLRPRGRVRIHSRQVCVSASATGTAALLLRSEVPSPPGSIGDNLHIHPAVIVAGDFDEPVRAWQGIPQTFECTEFLDIVGSTRRSAEVIAGRGRPSRIWIVPAFGHPMGTATMLPGHGEAHRALMARYGHFAVLTAMLHDHSRGRVRPRGDTGLTIDYTPDAADRAELFGGLVACARLLFAAGARRVLLTTDPLREITSEAELAAIELDVITPGAIDLSAVHPMSSVPMGDDPATAAVDSRGRSHHLAGLWVADGSLFPSSIGVPPQLSIYSLGLHVGRAITAAST